MANDTTKLLFVESEPVLAEVTAFRLELLGYEVSTVETGEEAVSAIEKDLPDLVIVDLILPVMSGIELIERLASHERTSKVPVMALSIEADLDAVQKAFNAGATDYLVAPYDPLVLEEKVETLLESSGAHLAT